MFKLEQTHASRSGKQIGSSRSNKHGVKNKAAETGAGKQGVKVKGSEPQIAVEELLVFRVVPHKLL